MGNIKLCSVHILLKPMHDKTVNKFSFFYIRNTQGLNKCYRYQPWPSAPVITFTTRKIASACENSPVVSPSSREGDFHSRISLALRFILPCLGSVSSINASGP